MCRETAVHKKGRQVLITERARPGDWALSEKLSELYISPAACDIRCLCVCRPGPFCGQPRSKKNNIWPSALELEGKKKRKETERKCALMERPLHNGLGNPSGLVTTTAAEVWASSSTSLSKRWKEQKAVIFTREIELIIELVKVEKVNILVLQLRKLICVNRATKSLSENDKALLVPVQHEHPYCDTVTKRLYLTLFNTFFWNNYSAFFKIRHHRCVV